MRAGRCLEHRQVAHRLRGGAAARGFGSRQAHWRLLILGRDPVCRGCQLAPSVYADHIAPVPPDDRNAGDWSEDNGQGLCPSCDAFKRQREQRDPRFGPTLRAQGAAMGQPAPPGWRHTLDLERRH